MHCKVWAFQVKLLMLTNDPVIMRQFDVFDAARGQPCAAHIRDQCLLCVLLEGNDAVDDIVKSHGLVLVLKLVRLCERKLS